MLRATSFDYQQSVCLLELALERESDRHDGVDYTLVNDETTRSPVFSGLDGRSQDARFASAPVGL